MTNKNLQSALSFLEVIDQLKDTYRQCLTMSGSRNENTAEHTFSLAMAVIVLSRFSNQPIDVNKTIKMALFHDLAEAIMGDTFHYDKQKTVSPVSEEEALKSMLIRLEYPVLENEILELWREFEFGQTPESVFLRGIDRFLPMYHNFKTQGHSWKKHSITMQMALEKNSHIEKSSAEIWTFTLEMLSQSQGNGWIG